MIRAPCAQPRRNFRAAEGARCADAPSPPAWQPFAMVSRSSLASCPCLVAALAAGCFDDGAPQPGGCTSDGAVAVANEGWPHVDGEEKLVYESNPPASGPHFNVWASYAIHEEVVNRGNWVHNLEHGAIVLLIGPDASDAQRQTILDAYEAIPNDANCGHRRAVVTEDPLLDGPMAAVAANNLLEGDALTVDQIVEFAVACRDRAPEDICL